jgi:3-oxoacyl-[acyl-carrier-protein] synthase III
MERFYVNLHNYSNTAAASALIAFDEAESILKEGYCRHFWGWLDLGSIPY